MSCDNSIPLDQIVTQVRDALAADFITAERPNINGADLENPILRSPSIRGDILFDSDARKALRFATNTNSVDKPVVSGSRADGTALTSVIQALVSLGFIVDETVE